jgi:hypothetical protein
MTAPERKIASRIHDFDLISLLELLEYLGYHPEEIYFRSHLSTSSQPSPERPKSPAELLLEKAGRGVHQYPSVCGFHRVF